MIGTTVPASARRLLIALLVIVCGSLIWFLPPESSGSEETGVFGRSDPGEEGPEPGLDPAPGPVIVPVEGDEPIGVPLATTPYPEMAQGVPVPPPEGDTVSRGGSLFIDVPSEETILSAALPQLPNPDETPSAFGGPDGTACVLALENFTLRSLHSADDARTFSTETDVAGAEGQNPVQHYRAAQADDGRIYVLLVVAHPAGGFGLEFIRSDDMCLTWTSPVEIVGGTETAPDNFEVAIAANGSGVVAVLYLLGAAPSAYVSVSSDSGNQWTEPYPVISDGSGAVPFFGDVAVHPETDAVHVALAGYDYSLYSYMLWTSQSTDLGTSFDDLTNHAGLVSPISLVWRANIEVAQDGGILVALGVSVSSSQDDDIVVLRSTNHGASYSRVYRRTFGFFNNAFSVNAVQLTTAPGSSTVVLSYVDRSGILRAHNSLDNGATWGYPSQLSYTVESLSFPFPEPVTRSSDGRWVTAWTDLSFANEAHLSDVFTRTSPDDGENWYYQQRLNGVSTPPVSSDQPDIAATGTGAVFSVFADTREGAGITADLFVARSDPGAVSFGDDSRIDTDFGTISPPTLGPVIGAADNGHVYVAFSTGPDLYVSASTDGGRIFGDPVLAQTDVGDIEPHAVSASLDGHVYVVFGVPVASPAVTRADLWFTRSTDHGATWSEAVLLDTYTFRRAVMESTPDGKVYVAWGVFPEIFLARSDDRGASFTIRDIDQNDTNDDQYPVMCAQGDQVAIAWTGRNPEATSRWAPLAVVSHDGGVTFDPLVNLRESAGTGSSATLPKLACSGAGEIVAAWTDRRSGTAEVYTNRFDGTLWEGDGPAATPEDLSVVRGVTFVDSSSVVVTQEIRHEGGADSAVYVSRSGDGGITFDSFTRLDDTAPDPPARSERTRTVSDGQGNAWVVWVDASVGTWWSIAMTRSTDSGVTWEPVRRVNRDPQQGAFSNYFSSFNLEVAAAIPGVAMFVWNGQRESPSYSTLFNRDAVNTPPTAVAGPDQTPECTGPLGATVELDGSASSDPDSTLGTNDDIETFEWIEDFGLPSETFLGEGEMLDVTLSLGVHIIILRVTDRAGATDTSEVSVTVADMTPPTLSVEVDPGTLWPPNHRVIEVQALVSAADTCSVPAVTLISVTSSEPDDAAGNGDGSTDDDIQDAEVGTADFEFGLRAERAGSGDGRTYTVVYTATDGSGNVSSAPAFVSVPHDQGGVSEPVQSTVGENGDGTVLWWTEAPGADFYNIIRGQIANIRETDSSIDLGAVLCIEAASVDASTAGWEDDGLPSPGEAFFYLIEYRHGSSSSYGTDTAPKPRIPGTGDCH